MAKLILANIANLQNEGTVVTTLESNNDLTEAALENTLSRDGTIPNMMLADLDMNSNRILNCVDAINDQEPATFGQLMDFLDQITSDLADAQAAAAAAAVSAAAAALSFDDFDDLYLGAKASAPSFDNDGDPLEEGMLYFDTTDDLLYVWDGDSWEQAAVPITGSVLGPVSSTDTAIAVWDGVSGTQLKDSTVFVGASGDVASTGTGAAFFAIDRDGAGASAFYRDTNVTRLWNEEFNDVLSYDTSGIITLPAYSTGFIKSTSGVLSSQTATQTTAFLNAFVGDTGSGGTKGLVPAPIAGDATKFLQGDGTWTSVPAGYTDEQAQDAVGTILVDSTTIDFTYADATPSITAIVIDDSITNAKLANMSASTVKGQIVGGSGDPVDLTAAQLITIINTADGIGSGLDADLLDGNSSDFYATATSVSDHLADTSDAHDASAISVADAGGNYTATEVEAALAEVMDALQSHEVDTADAHDASAISFAPAGNIAATDVQAAIAELDGEKQPLDADLTSWALITRAAGFDTFVATPTSANFATLVTGETGTGALVFGTSPALTTPEINDTSSDHQYVFAVSELTADRTVTLPLLTGNDTFTFNAFAATLTNKTVNLTNNTLTGTTAEFNTANSDANFYTTGGTDVALADGGTGASLTAPSVDRLLMWDQGTTAVKFGAIADFGTEGAPAAADYILGMDSVTDAVVKIAWSSLPGAGTIGGSTGATDNSILRADGTGGATLQNSLVTIADTGGISLTTTTGAAVLSLTSDATSPFVLLDGYGGGYPYFWMASNRGTIASPDYLDSADTLGRFFATSGLLDDGGGFIWTATENHSATNQGAGVGLWTVPNTTVSPLPAMFADQNGFLGVGVFYGPVNSTHPDRRLHVYDYSSATNTVTPALRLTFGSTGTPDAGIGVGIEFEVHTSGSNLEVGATIEAVLSDDTPTNEDFDLVFKLMRAGAAVTGQMTLDSQGGITLPDSWGTEFKTPSGNQGPISFYTLMTNPGAPGNFLGGLSFNGFNSVGGSKEYSSMYGVVVDPTSTSEYGEYQFLILNAGAQTLPLRIGAGVAVGSTSTTYKGGLGTLHVERATSATNTVTNTLFLTSLSSGTPANGIGVGIEFAVETDANNVETVAVIEAVVSDVSTTAGASEDADLRFQVKRAGTLATDSWVPRTKRLGSDHTLASGTGTEVTGLEFNSVQPGTYIVQYFLICQSSATGTGIGLGHNFTGTAAVKTFMRYDAATITTASNGLTEEESGVALVTGGVMNAWATKAYSTTAPTTMSAGVGAADNDVMIKIEGVVIVTAAGDLELWHSSETANNTSIKVGSSAILTKTA